MPFFLSSTCITDVPVLKSYEFGAFGPISRESLWAMGVLHGSLSL